MSPRRTRWTVASVITVAVVGPLSWAFATIFASGTTNAVASADSLAAPGAPVAARAARDITITWTGSATGDGVPADRYTVERVLVGGEIRLAVTCAEPIVPLTCVDHDVPTGDWQYGIVAHLHAWDSDSSELSAQVSIGAPTLEIAPEQTVRPGQPLAAGSLSNFHAGELVTVRSSEGGAVLGTATADDDGNAVVNLVVPAEAADGAYTPIATGDLGASATSTATYTVDGTAPITTATVTGVPGTNGWYHLPVSVALVSDDPAAVITYTLDGPGLPGAAQTYAGAITIPADGTYALHFAATDALGNVEPTNDLAILVDSAAPNPTLTIPATINGSYQFTITPGDPAPSSGIASVEYSYCSGTPCRPEVPIGTSTAGPDFRVSFTTPPADGDIRVRATVTDVAGNVTTTARQLVQVDTTKPTGTITTPTASGFAGGSAFTFSATAADVPASPTSGSSSVRNVFFEYRAVGAETWINLGGDNTEPYAVSRSLLNVANGSYEIHLIVNDRAGNQFVSEPQPFTVENVLATGVALVNGGATTGLIEQGDQMVVTFDQALHVSSICSTWTDDNAGQHLAVDARLTDGGTAADSITLTTTAPCTPNVGSLLLGSGNYLASGAVNFVGGDLSWNPATKQLTLLLGTPDNAAAIVRVANNTNATFTPSSALVSIHDVAINPRIVRTGPARQF